MSDARALPCRARKSFALGELSTLVELSLLEQKSALSCTAQQSSISVELSHVERKRVLFWVSFLLW